MTIQVQSLDSAAFGDGAVLGCDFVGVVEDIGNGVTRLAKGDVIAALIWGGKRLTSPVDMHETLSSDVFVRRDQGPGCIQPVLCGG